MPRDRAGQCSRSGKTWCSEEFSLTPGRVGNGRGTPRDPGRAKFLIATQQVTAADSTNNGPHS